MSSAASPVIRTWAPASVPPTARPICTFFAMGGCSKGERCPFSHELVQVAPKGVDVSAGFYISGNVANYKATSTNTAVSILNTAKATSTTILAVAVAATPSSPDSGRRSDAAGTTASSTDGLSTLASPSSYSATAIPLSAEAREWTGAESSSRAAVTSWAASTRISHNSLTSQPAVAPLTATRASSTASRLTQPPAQERASVPQLRIQPLPQSPTIQQQQVMAVAAPALHHLAHSSPRPPPAPRQPTPPVAEPKPQNYYTQTHLQQSQTPLSQAPLPVQPSPVPGPQPPQPRSVANARHAVPRPAESIQVSKDIGAMQLRHASPPQQLQQPQHPQQPQCPPTTRTSMTTTVPLPLPRTVTAPEVAPAAQAGLIPTAAKPTAPPRYTASSTVIASPTLATAPLLPPAAATVFGVATRAEPAPVSHAVEPPLPRSHTVPLAAMTALHPERKAAPAVPVPVPTQTATATAASVPTRVVPPAPRSQQQQAQMRAQFQTQLQQPQQTLAQPSSPLHAHPQLQQPSSQQTTPPAAHSRSPPQQQFSLPQQQQQQPMYFLAPARSTASSSPPQEASPTASSPLTVPRGYTIAYALPSNHATNGAAPLVLTEQPLQLHSDGRQAYTLLSACGAAMPSPVSGHRSAAKGPVLFSTPPQQATLSSGDSSSPRFILVKADGTLALLQAAFAPQTTASPFASILRSR